MCKENTGRKCMKNRLLTLAAGGTAVVFPRDPCAWLVTACTNPFLTKSQILLFPYN